MQIHTHLLMLILASKDPSSIWPKAQVTFGPEFVICVCYHSLDSLSC